MGLKSVEMEQSAAARPLREMKKVRGERNRRSQRVGMSLTSIQKAAKMKRMTSRFARKRMPEKESWPRFARLAESALRKRSTARPRPATPSRGNCIRGGVSVSEVLPEGTSEAFQGDKRSQWRGGSGTRSGCRSWSPLHGPPCTIL